jgi:hypothetical protein
MSAAGVAVSTAPNPGARAGSTPSAALHAIRVKPVPFAVAKEIITRHHYLHSLAGGTVLSFGVFWGSRLMGAVTLGAGPANAYRLVKGAAVDDCLTLSRFWLADELPPNSESRTIGIILRSLRKHSGIRFLVSYADPAHGHVGVIYQATGWLYTGLSSATPLYDVGDGIGRHPRSIAHKYGSRSLRYLKANGVPARAIPGNEKHRYICFIDSNWCRRLRVPVLPYPKLGAI